MAAKDSGGHQEFPLAAHDMPPLEQIEEASAIAENLLEGHQGVGQSLHDPYTCAVHYLEKHRIVEILQVTMVTFVEHLKHALPPQGLSCSLPACPPSLFF